jgi:dTDP-4-amino-4,6-dideoxygalactose transaminase
MAIPFLDLQAMHAEVAGELTDGWRQVSRSAKFIGGELVERFEAEWATYCQAAHCVGVASGTAALELSMAGLGIGQGDEVIVPANTFIATATAVVAVGATPVFVDVDRSTLLMTAAGVEAALTPRTAAIIPVHLYGQPVDMDAINKVASAAGLVVIEDAAQAHGASWKGKPVGTLGRVGCFSFYPGKNLGAFGDAGAVVTHDFALAQRIRSIGNYGRLRSHFRHEVARSTNSRLDALQAAILSVKLRRLDAWNDGRRRAAARYELVLADLPVRMIHSAPGAFNTYHLAVIRTPRRDELRHRLESEGISTGIHYPIPCHLQPAFATEAGPSLPVAEQAAKEVLSLPMYPHLGDAEISVVAEAIDRALADLSPSPRLASSERVGSAQVLERLKRSINGDSASKALIAGKLEEVNSDIPVSQ